MNLLAIQPRLIALFCAAGAVGLGLLYMLSAGAPSGYLIINLGALLLGSSLWLALGRTASAPLAAAGWVTLALALVLIATALFGVAVDGASRWVRVGGLTLQISLILVPVILVLYVRRPNAIGTGAMMIAALALALQPDRAMAGVLMTALLASLIARPGRLAALASTASVLAFGWTWLTPDMLPAVPFVDRIFYTAFDVSLFAGFAVVTGAMILLLPALFGLLKAQGDLPVMLAFGGCWAAVVAAAALGNYPTPLVGYGGSAVLGYLLSVALLPHRPCRTATARIGASLAGQEEASLAGQEEDVSGPRSEWRIA